MNENNLKSIIEQVIRELNVADEPSKVNVAACPLNETTCDVPEITAYEMENYFEVPSAENKDAYLNYKKSTPARVGIWRAGPRYTTQTMLRFRADHAVAQDAVFTDVSDETIEKHGWLKLQTAVKDKDEYLTRPDLGRIIDEESIALLKAKAKASPKVQIYISDGLSSTAIEANAYDTYKSMEQGLKSHGIEVGTPFFVKYGRVPAMDHISELMNAEVTVV